MLKQWSNGRAQLIHGANGGVRSTKSVGYRLRSWTAESVRVGERKSILPKNLATNIQMAVSPKVRYALCTASHLPGEGPTDVEDAPAPAC